MLLDIANERELDHESCRVKVAILNFFTVTLSNRCKGDFIYSTARVKEVLEVATNILHGAKESYTKYFTHEDDLCQSATSYTYTLIWSTLSFINKLITCQYYKALVTVVMGDIMRLLLFYIQGISFSESTCQVSQDILVVVKLNSNSVRNRCRRIITEMCDSGELRESFQDFIFPLIYVQQRTVQNLKSQGNTYWWKLQEACYQVIYDTRTTMIACVNKNDGSRDILYLLSSVVIPDISSNVQLLATLARKVFSEFLDLHSSDKLAQLIDLILLTVSPEANELLLISNIRALKIIYYVYEGCYKKTLFNLVLSSKFTAVFEACLNTLRVLKDDLLDVTYDLITLLIKKQPQICSSHEMKLMQRMLDVSTSDTQSIYRISRVFHLTVPNVLCVEAIKKTWIPYIVQVLNSSEAEFEDQELAFNVLLFFVYYSVEPFKMFLVDECFEALLDCTKSCLGAYKCLSYYVRYSSHHLNNLKDSLGTTYRELVYNFIINLFTNSESTSDGLSLSSLCSFTSVFLEKFHSTMEESLIYILLQVLLDKLKKLQAASPEAAAVTGVFVCLINNDVEWITRYLRSITYDSGDKCSAFNVVLISILRNIEYKKKT